MTFKEFFDDVWRIQKHHVLLFEESDSYVVETWADENENGLWKDIPAYTIAVIDAFHTGAYASDFLAEKWLKAEVTSLIILSGCVCVFLAPQNEASPIEDIKSEINELSELNHIEPTYEDCKRDVLEIINKCTSGAKIEGEE